MAADGFLEKVRGLASANRIALTAHASQRMRTRSVQYGDLRHALVNASAASRSADERWRVKGPDLDGEELSIVRVIEDGIIVATVF